MATKKPVYDRPDDNTVRITYTGLTTADDGEPFQLPEYSDRSVQLTGTLGVGGTMAIEGANDDVPTYQTLTDQNDNNLSLNALKTEQVMQVTLRTRPRPTAGDGTTNLNVIFLCRRPKPVNK